MNIETNKIETSEAKTLINIPLPSIPFAVHVKGEYIHINFKKMIRESFSEHGTRQFMQLKYHCDTLTFKNSNGCIIRPVITSYLQTKGDTFQGSSTIDFPSIR